jgi:release factor glutamine methyltransferase
MTIAQALAVGVMRLRRADRAEVRESARADAQILLGEVLQWDRTRLLARGDEELDGELLEVFGLLLDERLRGVPVPYLTHKAGFYGREFYVDEHVLVPRPESEHLIEAALRELRARLAEGRTPSVLDVGTGSGALAITLAAELPELRVTAVERSGEALVVARRNASDLLVNVEFVQGDLSAPLAGRRFDCVVANLPYVPTADLPEKPDPAGFEPVPALDGGADGLGVYRRLLRELPELAEPGAYCAFEAAPPTVYGLAAMVQQTFPGMQIDVGNDYAGLERFLTFTVPRP